MLNRVLKLLRRIPSEKNKEPSLLWRYVYWTPAVCILGDFFYNLKTVSGRSMQPTLNPDSSPRKDVGLFDRYAIHTLQRYQREDIVALKSPEDPKRTLVKRIVAMPGDRVKTLPPCKDAEVVIPPGHVWIEGDEPFHSDDSNRFGPVSMSLIESRLVCVVWPLDRLGIPRDPDTVRLLAKAGGDLRTQRTAKAELERLRRRQDRVVPGLNEEPAT
ncbi:hypothetical protein PQX77_000072 [Marasmius sp. AFHP31]|nr:hypothetical protein PQX77_000072 [Marasmius sp. AFHP31]